MRKEYLKEIGVILVFALILFLFYRSLWAMPALIPAAVIYHRFNRKRILMRSRSVLSAQFRDALVSLTSALRAGYSMENAIAEAVSDMKSVYGEKSGIFKGLNQVLNEIKLGIGTEKALSNFARRSGVESVLFAEKRAGKADE